MNGEEECIAHSICGCTLNPREREREKQKGFLIFYTMSKKALATLFDLESQERGGSPSFMSQTLSKDPQPTSDGDGGRIPLEEWLPITESRKGNVYTATFHLFCSGLGLQVLLLPAAFAALGW